MCVGCAEFAHEVPHGKGFSSHVILYVFLTEGSEATHSLTHKFSMCNQQLWLEASVDQPVSYRKRNTRKRLDDDWYLLDSEDG